jgi:uroporphyrinogen decarboxylase
MPAESLTPRARVLLALDHKPTDRVPMTFAYAGIERPVQEVLARHLGLASAEEVYAHFDCYEDIALVGPNFRGADPDYRGPTVWRSAGGYDDIWGCRWEPLDPETGPYDISRQPFAEAKDPSDLDRHTWPAADWWDWDAIAERIAHARDRKDYALCMHSGNLWERAWWMRGFENSLFDMIENPAVHHALMERITTFYLDVTKRILEIADGAIDLAFTADDIGGQDGLLLSLAMWEQNIKPYHSSTTWA